MDDKKSGGTATLERPVTKAVGSAVKEAVKETVKQSVNVTGQPDPKRNTQLEEREHRTEELIHQMEERMKKAARDFNASGEVQREVKELSHEMAGRIRRISQTAKTEDAFERDVDEAVASAARYIINKARTENKEKKKEEAEKSDKEREKRVTKHEPEKPETTAKATEKTAAVTDKKDETVNNKPAVPENKVGETSDNPLITTPLAAKKEPVNTQQETKKPPSQQKTQKENAGKKSAPAFVNDSDKSKVHNELAHSIQSPETDTKTRYTTKKEDVKMRTKMTGALADPEQELHRQLDELKKKLLHAYINRRSLKKAAKNAFINRRNKKRELAESEKAVPLNKLFFFNRKRSGTYIPIQQHPSENELLSENDNNELSDRGTAVMGNTRSDTFTPFGREYTESVYIPGKKPVSGGFSEIETTDPNPRHRSSANEAQQQKTSDSGGGGGGGGRHRKKTKNRAVAKFEEKIGQQAAKQVLFALLRPPLVFYLIAVLVIVYIIILIIMIIAGAPDDPQGEFAIPVTISKTGPTKGSLGQNLDYTIAVGYAGNAQDMIVVDTLPKNAKYISSTPAGTYDVNTNTVTWNAKTLGVTMANPFTWNIKITLQAQANNVYVVNKATATVVAASGGSGVYNAPTANNCNGKYSFSSPLKMNFGDPSCDFTKDKLYTQLKSADPTNADVWFNKIIPCESGYNANAYAPPSTGTPDAAGAWGLYQMGSSTPPGSAPPAAGKNGINDRGDVPWDIQTTNATTYGKKISSLKAYWACAR